MSQVRYILVGPAGKSASVSLPNDRVVSQLHGVIADALKLSKAWELILRKEDGALIDQQGTLAAAQVHRDGRIVVEASRTPRFIESLARRSRLPKAPPGAEIHVPMYRVMPCYLVIDTSASMFGPAMDKINAEVPRLQDTMALNLQLAAVCHLGIITFDSSARVHTPLADVTTMEFTPLFPEGALTEYRAALELLRDVISKDLYRLYLQGLRPQRAVVFFLSDGNATSDWSDAISRLAEPNLFYGAPHVIAFGFGAASEASIKMLGRTRAYMPVDGARLPDLQSFMAFMLNSMTMSVTQADGDDDDPFRAPTEAPTGWRSAQ